MLGPSLPRRSQSIFNQVAQSEYISPSQVAYSHQSNLIRGDHGQINPTKPYHHLRRFRLSRVALRASPISRPWLDAPELPRNSPCRLLQQCQRQLHRLRPFGTTGRLECQARSCICWLTTKANEGTPAPSQCMSHQSRSPWVRFAILHWESMFSPQP